MKHLLPLILILTLRCGGGSSDTTHIPPDPINIPEVALTPDTDHELTYQLMAQREFKYVEGCVYELWPDGRDIDEIVFLFSSLYGTGEAILAGNSQRFEQISESENRPTLKGTKTFVHGNDAYEVTTVVTFESMHDMEEVWDLSGTLTFVERATGKTVRIEVQGDEGC